jgi:prolyl-tRNA synthetase
MRLSGFLQKSIKTYREDLSKNASLLVKAGFVDCLMSGVYSYLPMGLRVLTKIEAITREEINNLGAQEVLLPALQPREIWDATGRWDKIDVLFKLKGHGDRDLVLGATHEEVATPLMRGFINSYRDLPKSIFQIQTKFRNETRAKSGILRCREFKMKDMYSFHATQEDLDNFYEKVILCYKRIYDRCGIGDKTILTYASGGAFSKYSHEFQTITPAGEDVIYKISDNLALNEEIIGDKGVLEEFNIKNKNLLNTEKTIEVGNIFKLGIKYSSAFGIRYNDKDGNENTPLMGCYGIGVNRVMGAVAECLGDDYGLVWPEEIAPFKFHLVSLVFTDDEISKCDEIYEKLMSFGCDTLYDDRRDVKAGEKLNDADLMGIPHRLIVSAKTLAEGKIEYKKRTEKEKRLLSLEEFFSMFSI